MGSQASWEIQCGLNLTVQYPPGQDPVRAIDEHLRLVAAARDAGWHSVFVAQHYLTEQFAHPQPLPLLGRLSAMSGSMRLGAGICLLALQNPVDVAEAYATADVLTGGRLVFGAGLGYREQEYAAFAVPIGQRVARFSQNLAAVRQLWAGEAVDIDLPWCQASSARLSMLPIQRPSPPVWLAANSDRAVERAARHGDTWMINPHATIATVERQLDVFRHARAAAGLPAPTEVPLMREVVCAADRAAAAERAHRHLAAKYSTYHAWGQDSVLPEGDRFGSEITALAQDRFAVGNPSDCREILQNWLDRTGANHLILRVHWAGAPIEEGIESIGLLSTEVLPKLRSRAHAENALID